MTVDFRSEPLAFDAVSDEEGKARLEAFARLMKKRRTVRDFSSRPVPRSVIEQAVMVAAGAPSGANQQPWSFVAIENPAVKRRSGWRRKKRSGPFTKAAPARNG